MKKWLFSKNKIVIDKNKKVSVLDLILKNNLTYIEIYQKNDEFHIVIYSKQLSQYKEVFDKNEIVYKTSDDYGVLSVFKRNKDRVGIILGVLILIIGTYICSNFVWRINISGNIECSDKEIEVILENAGFSLGRFIPTIDYNELHNKILLQSDKLSWISININGTVANVEVKETLKENNSKKEKYTNVISKYDGYIHSIKTINGERVVSVGDIVKKGDLLISGVLNSQAEGVRYVHASGDVKAYVNKEILVKVPLVSEQKVYTGKVIEEKKYKFFSKYINFSLKHSNYIDFYDKIEKIEPVCIFGFDNLPLEKITSKYYEYQIKKVVRTKEEAVDLAFIELNSKLSQAVKNAELVSKTVDTHYNNECIYLKCNIYCLETISEEVQFVVDE